MNILLIIVLLLLLFNVVGGYKKGMVREIISFVSMIVMCVVIALIGNGLKSYFEGELLGVVVVVLLLCLLGIAHHLLGVIFFSAKIISKLPIVHWLDKLLGVVVGILETILILWTIYTFIMMLDMGMVEQLALTYTQDSSILTWFYEHNYLAGWLQRIQPQITFLP